MAAALVIFLSTLSFVCFLMLLSTKPTTPLVFPENSAISSNTAKFFPTKLSLKSKSSGGYPVSESSGNKTISEEIFSASSNLLRIFSLFS